MIQSPLPSNNRSRISRYAGENWPCFFVLLLFSFTGSQGIGGSQKVNGRTLRPRGTLSYIRHPPFVSSLPLARVEGWPELYIHMAYMTAYFINKSLQKYRIHIHELTVPYYGSGQTLLDTICFGAKQYHIDRNIKVAESPNLHTTTENC
jgi:hypothetical protein